MGEEQQDRWDAGVEAAWTEFRGRLADRIAALADGEVIEAQLGCLGEDDAQNGAAPYVQFLAWGDGLVRAEAVSNTSLDPAFALESYDEMIEIGWCPPTYGEDQEPDHGSDNFWLDIEAREADRIAWMGVRALREIYGCIHPSFLTVEGLGGEPAGPVPVDEVVDSNEEPVAFHRDPEELQTLVVRAVGVLLDEDTVKVDDGDIPIRVGESVVFVRVHGDHPVVEVFAEIVIEPQDVDRLGLEFGILNRAHRFAKFFLAEDRVVMTHRLVAAPFAPAQLRLVVNTFIEDVDEIAARLAARVQGRRFLERAPEPATPGPRECPAMGGLLELMRVGRVASSSVVELFEHDRREIVRMIVEVRTGQRDCGDLDEEDVLDHLRRALGLVAREEARATRAASRIAAGGSTQQMSLLDPDTVMRAHRPRRRSA